jgi:hypothetical protein
VLGRLLGLALGDRVPEDSVANYVAAGRATGQTPLLDGPHFELSA